MDNFTLLETIIIILGINAIFTFVISKNVGINLSFKWRLSSLFVFTGFFLLLFQASIPIFISIIMSNYLLLIGSFYQILAALSFKTGKILHQCKYLSMITVVYAGMFFYFTYINFQTPQRIIVISILLFLIYGYAVFMIRQKIFRHDIRELFGLFIFAALFYAGRTTVTAIGMGAVSSLFDKNIITTVSFLYVIVFNLVYLMSMFNASIQVKNRQIAREKDKLNYLFDFLNDTAKHLKLEELYSSIEAVLRKSLGVSTAAIFLINEDKESHSIAYIFNELNVPIDQVKTLKRGEGASGQAIEQDKVIVVPIDEYPNKSVSADFKAKGVSDLVSIPLKTSEGIIGAITVVYNVSVQDNEIFDGSFFYYLGEQIGLVLHNALLYEKVIQTANTDPLTGLANRRKMQELFSMELLRARRNQGQFTIAMADLDYFKEVNDTYGHECGDEVLKKVAAVFQKECRESDYVCRWGGEEFLFLFIDSDLTAARSVAERIRLHFEQIHCTCVKGPTLTISMGLAEFHAELTMAELIVQADEALYIAKTNGRNRTAVFLI